jgi:prepilin peptidase CpaA
MSLLALLQACCLAAFALLLVAAAWQDLHTLRIANGFSLAIAASFVLWAAAGLTMGHLAPAQIAMAVGCAAAVFAVGSAAFAIGAIGGGDVKFLAAASLFAGLPRQFDFLTVTALAGGALGLAMLAGARIGPEVDSSGAVVGGRARHLPYGPAIAVGGLWVAASLAMA